MKLHPTAELLDEQHGVQLYREPNGFTIIRLWRGWRHVAALTVGSIVTGLAVLAFVQRNASNSYITNITPWWGLTALGIGICYYAATGLNRTVIRIGGDVVRVQAGPLPTFWRREQIYPMLRSVDVRFDRTVTMRGGVGDTHVVEGRTMAGDAVVLDLVPGKEQADAMVDLIRRAI